MPETALLVLTTLPDRDAAQRFAEQLVRQNLAACVNILGEMTSIYRWKGEIQRGTEHQLLIKTTQAQYAALETWIRDQHPYELPEILALPVARGLPDYLDWVITCIKN